MTEQPALPTTAEQPAFPHVLIRASAGTGKTFQLSNRYLALLEAGVAPDRILATTFTRKSAAEILDRIVLRLAAAVSDDDARSDLAFQIKSTALTQQRCQDLLADLLRDLHRLHVGTLDSFFAQMARSLSLEIGLPLAWQIIDQLQDAALRDEAIEAVVRKGNTSELLTLTHLLTKGEASRTVGQLIRSTVNDLESLYQETDAEAWHKVPRYKTLDESEFVLVLEDLRTLELSDKRFERARDADYQRALLGEWDRFITTGIAAKVADGEVLFYQKPIPDSAAAVYGRLLDHARALLVARVASQTAGSHDLLRQFDSEYMVLKQDRRATRFADITRSLGQPLREATAGDSAAQLFRQLAFRLDGHIHHILLDEFQDTAPAQWEVLRPFAQRVTNRTSRGSFFCVGDTKQAIYGWRGGVAEIFDAISSELPQLSRQELNASYRSSQPVIDTVNRVFTTLAAHPNLDKYSDAVTRWQQRFEPHSTRRSELPGYACLVAAPSADELLDFAAERVAAITSETPASSIGVLVRTNEAVGRLIGLLRDRGVFASEEGGNPLSDSAAIQLVLSLAHVADHPGDTVARFHIARSPIANAVSLPTHTDDRAARKFSQRQRESLIKRGYGPTISEWAEVIRSYVTVRDEGRLTQLIELAYSYQTKATGRVDDFVRFVEHERVADPTTARVRVMTVHQAKGLEFDVVVLPQLDVKLVGQPDSFVVHRDTPTSSVDRVCRYVNLDVQKLLPKPFQQMFVDANERVVTESLCVLYVALTRAVHALHMIIPPTAAKEKVVPKTYAGLLRTALRDEHPVTANSVLYEHGDSRWHTKMPPLKTDASSAKEPLPANISLAARGSTRRRGLERQSPSGLEGGSRVSLASVFEQRQSVAMLRGSVIHAWFEAIEWLDDGLPDDKRLRDIGKKLLIAESQSLDLANSLAEFRKMLQMATVRSTLSQTSYRDLPAIGFEAQAAARIGPPSRYVVENERSFAVCHDNQLLNGSIDRIVWLYSGEQLVAADIIDFKTDRVANESELAAKVDFYAPQLQAYRVAVCRMSGLASESVLARLLFVGTGMIANVE